VVFGGFAANELATRIDDAKPQVVLSASCGIEGSRVIAYKPLLDEAIGIAQHKPIACVILQRSQQKAKLDPDRDHDWRTLVMWASAEELRVADGSRNARGWPRPIRCTSCTPRGRREDRRAWCATTAATWSQCTGQ
jgi:acyl-coenzyme A synthetase/AMP-(fatty) acid ligase